MQPFNKILVKNIPPLHLQSRWISLTRRDNLKGTFDHVHRHLKDPYVKQRVIDNYRCRSAFKLIQIDEKYKILKPGDVAVDLGAAPGSWSQVLKRRMTVEDEKVGTVIAIDLQRIAPIEGIHTIQGDFTSTETQIKIVDILKHNNCKKIDVVVCDAAPNPSGIKSMDHDQLIKIVTSAAKFTFKYLKEGGTFLFKLWDGDQTNVLTRSLSKIFKTVERTKPHASRKDSAELYVVCKGFRGKKIPQ